MSTNYYEIEIKFRETGEGQAEIVVPKVLANKEWHYVQVHEGVQKAIIQVEASTKEHKLIAADDAFRPLTNKEMLAVRKSYPAPRLKQRYRPIEIQADVSPQEIKGEPAVETVQQVRWKFYLIDLPVQT